MVTPSSGFSGGAPHQLIVDDPDGVGGQPSHIVATGNYVFAGGVTAHDIAVWHADRWRAVNPAWTENNPYAVAARFDPDGPGGEAASVIAARVSINRVDKFDGGPQPANITQTLNASWLQAMAVFDPDGAGPSGSRLAIGGSRTFGTTSVGHATALWDGSSWLLTPTAGRLQGTLNCFAVQPASGGSPPRLVAGGSFQAAATGTSCSVAVLQDDTWLPLGTTTPGNACLALCWGDVAGSPIAGPTFYGLFGSVVSAFDGTHWVTVASVPPTTTFEMAIYDPDAAGPAPSAIYIGGTFHNVQGLAGSAGIAAWHSGQWRSVGGGVHLLQSSANDVTSLATADILIDGHLRHVLLVAGEFGATGSHIPGPNSSPARRLATWDGEAWIVPDNAPNRPLDAAIVHDLDGGGPGRPEIIAAGDFYALGGRWVASVARFDGARWNPLDEGLVLSTSPAAIRRYRDFVAADLDGDGPLPSTLFLAGSGIRVAEPPTTATGLVCWDGNQWQDLPSSVSGTISDVVDWDPDGGGPQAEQVVALGFFGDAAALGPSAWRVASWNGEAWTNLYTLATGSLTGLTVHDLDGSGPQAPSLIVRATGVVPEQQVLAYDGQAWSDINQGYFTTSDSEPGIWSIPGFPSPTDPAALISVGQHAGVRTLARLTAAGWQEIPCPKVGTSRHAPVELVTFDDDGPGPRPRTLFSLIFPFSEPDELAPTVFRLDGPAWELIGRTNLGGSFTLPGRSAPRRLLPFDPDGAGAAMESLYMVGAFGQVDDVPATTLARWGLPDPLPCPPDITTAAVPGSPGYGTPNGILNNDDFFYYLTQFASGNIAVADLTTGAVAGQPGYGVPNGVLNNDDFFYYLSIFAAGC